MCVKAYLITISIDNLLDLTILRLGQLVQRTHAPVLIRARGTHHPRRVAIEIGLHHAGDDIDEVGLGDVDDVVTAGLGVLEDDALALMRVEEGVTRVRVDEDDPGAGLVGLG